MARSSRYRDVDTRKASGATYTPPALARYLASCLVEQARPILDRSELHLLDPALGDGVLVEALLEALARHTKASLRVTAFETDRAALRRASERLSRRHPRVGFNLLHGDFLRGVAGPTGADAQTLGSFDLIIANPPYVRTQVLGADEARSLAGRFGLGGRVDLYHAFLLAMVFALRPAGLLGVITSNRFMTTRGAGALRSMLRSRLELLRVWDLGDTKLFDAAVLPALIVAGRAAAAPRREDARFTSIYRAGPTKDAKTAPDVVGMLECDGTFMLKDGRTFDVQQGTLDPGDSTSSLWRLSTSTLRAWLDRVAQHTWAPLRTLGKVRVGVKTTADRVFIRDDWSTLADSARPELLRPLMTHHIGRRFRAEPPVKQILYPHLVRNGVRVVANLDDYPNAANYLERHRSTLEARTYVSATGRKWYELWVPQDPAAWSQPKLVFRDICQHPTFWVDQAGCVVNGDCYWLASDSPDLLWLAVAISNSTFIEQFYDKRFNNKLYAGRRRFITQYVEEFPLPDPDDDLSKAIIDLAQERGAQVSSPRHAAMEQELDALVWRAFGFPNPTPR